jgi:hypothetical protein
MMCVTFDESDGLLQSVSVFVTIVQNVSANFESGRIQKNRIDLIDGVQHRLQRLYIFIEISICYDILIRKQTEYNYLNASLGHNGTASDVIFPFVNHHKSA